MEKIKREVRTWEDTISRLGLYYDDYQAQQKATSVIQVLKQIESILVFFMKVEELNLEAKILRKNLRLTIMPNLYQELQAALAGLILDNPSYKRSKEVSLMTGT